MTRYATTTAAAMVLLTSLTFDCDVWLLRTAASEWDAAPPVPRTYGTGGLDRRRAYADNPSYVSGGGGVGDDDDDDGVTDGQNPSQHEDQLDQDDPVSTVTVTAVRGSLAWLPCDIGGGNNDGLPMQLKKVAGRTKDSGNAPEDRAYMVLWFKHQNGPTIRHRNSKFKNNKMSSGGKPLYSFDVRGRPLAHALKWSSDEDHGGFGPRASFVVFGGAREKWTKQRTAWPDDHVGLYDNSSEAALRVFNVTERDAGAYRCRVDFRDSPTRNYRIILQVIVPPDKMTIIFNGESEIDGGSHNIVGPVPEGGQLILVCKVQGGKPKPRVQWYSTDDTVISSFDTGTLDFENKQSFGNDHDREGTTIKKLVINNLNRSHANSTYTCLAGNNDNDADSSLRKSVLINMYLNVKSVRIVGVRPINESENTVNYNEESNYEISYQGTSLISGMWYTAECRAEGASPKAKIEWSIDGNGTLGDEMPFPPTPGNITVVEQTEHSSKIHFKPTPGDDGRYLRCRAWNPDINTTNDNVKIKALLLNVQYPPIVKLSLGHTFDPGRIKTGDDVYFECKVLDGSGKGKQPNNRIEWYHNNHPISQNGSGNSSISVNSDVKVVLLSAGTLVLRNVGRHHSGRYTCQCSNDLGTGRSRPVTLRVQYAPLCADDGGHRQLVGVEKNEANVRVACRVKADPVDERMQFEWLVWPGPVSDLHPQRSAATGSYVTAAVLSQRNDTAVGELVLPAMTVAEAAQFADRAAASKRPFALDTVSCRATNAVGRQQTPCLYHIIPATSPGPLTGCVIRLPEDLERRFGNGDRYHHQKNDHRRRTLPHISAGDRDVATVSCSSGNDGGVRPVTYSLEIYESNVLTTFSGSAELADGIKHHNRWLVNNVTGTAVIGGGAIEYRVNRNNLRLRLDLNDKRKCLSLSAYAANRMGRGPQNHIGSENTVLLRDLWWWRGSKHEKVDESSTKPSGTSSTEWWITMNGDDNHRTETASDGGTTTSVVVTSILAAIAVMVFILLWKRRGVRRSSAVPAVDAGVAAGLIATSCRGDNDGGEASRKYSSLASQLAPESHRQHVYPNLSYDDRAAPDITVQQNYDGKRCLRVSITDNAIPGPESCV